MPIHHNQPIAYFCAEYGLDHRLPLYAGGLGILAGDTIKEAADQNQPFVGIGLLYRGYNAVQQLSPEGMQIDSDYLFDPLSIGFEHVYIDEQPVFIKVHLTQVDVWVRCWKKTLSENVVLYLLDTETDQNELSERSITQILYSGTHEQQIKQQLILGIGGVKLLERLGIHPRVYHLNEGRASFLHWQLIRQLMDTHGLSYESARQLAIDKTVYTNHTLVAAGNQTYSADLIRVFGQYYADKMNIGIERLIAPGIHPDNTDGFSITQFALNCSRKANGVSQLHSQLSEDNWPGYHWTNITNGVHLPTWQAPGIQEAKNDRQQLWHIHTQQKQVLATYVLEKTGFTYDPSRLVIGWARRLAGYKQLPLIFQDLNRLAAILKNEERPIQLLIAGKAHLGDAAGKEMLQQIIGYMTNELSGHALFIPNYHIEIAQMMVRGCDVWLNTPAMGQEACGTSGMKAVSNGTLHCTTPDGWAAEVDWNGTGWVLDDSTLTESFYETLENKIAPLFYSRDENRIPQDWLEMMQRSISLADQYSTKRMLAEYNEKLYL
jgi:glucan phosphorylase